MSVARMHASLRRSQASGFVLLEALLAVAIFALGVISLGRCVSNCVAVERLRAEGDQARQILENRRVAIESGAIPLGPEVSESLPPPLGDWQIRQTSALVDKRNENGQPFTGLQIVHLELRWSSGRETEVRTLVFYAQSRIR